MKHIFKKLRPSKMAIVISSIALLAFTGNRLLRLHPQAMRPFAVTDSCECYSSQELDNLYVYFNNSVPGDLPAFNNQSPIDCFAWQEFIALNWPANPSAPFGKPGDTSPVQWETYTPRNVLFPPNGQRPRPFGTLVPDEIIAAFNTKAQRKLYSASENNILSQMLQNTRATKVLLWDSKFGFEQAAPGGKPNWLGAQNGTNLWYEVMLNRDYYDYIVNNGFYNAAVQHDSVRAGVPIVFPKGGVNGPTGAIELKAAWMEVDNPGNPKWNRYKLSSAIVKDGTTGKIRRTTVALVGLHILHKTTNQPTWVWSTFEQVDNVVENEQPRPPYGYNLFNPACTTQRVTVRSQYTGKDTTVVITCAYNNSPPYYLKQGKPVPLQVSRTNAIDTNDARPINKMMQQNIRKYNPNSVWQYYQLVDVIWSQQLQPDPTRPIQTPRPLNVANMTSGVTTVANTTMETYVQNTNTCFSCHVFGHIAPYPPDSANNNIVGDMSFAIKFATYPKISVGEKTKIKTKR